MVKLITSCLLFFFLSVSQARLISTNEYVELPLLIDHQGVVSTEITLQGKKIPLVFDTGASKSALVLNEKIVKQLNYQPALKENCSNTVSGEVCLKTFTIHELMLGNLPAAKVEGEMAPRQLWGGNNAFVETTASKNGLIGLELLKKYNVLIDYQNKKVILTKLGYYPKNYSQIETWQKIPFKLQQGISTEVILNGHSVRLIWDTGANISVLKKGVIKQGLQTCPKKESYEPGCQYFISKQFSIDGKEIGPAKFTVLGKFLPFDGLIGSDYFIKHKVFLDFQHYFLYIEK